MKIEVTWFSFSIVFCAYLRTSEHLGECKLPDTHNSINLTPECLALRDLKS
jgi:hypothetical protein